MYWTNQRPDNSADRVGITWGATVHYPIGGTEPPCNQIRQPFPAKKLRFLLDFQPCLSRRLAHPQALNRQRPGTPVLGFFDPAEWLALLVGKPSTKYGGRLMGFLDGASWLSKKPAEGLGPVDKSVMLTHCSYLK
jgi:hypothetical protein